LVFFLGVVFFQYPFPISGLEFPVRKLAEGNLNSLQINVSLNHDPEKFCGLLTWQEVKKRNQKLLYVIQGDVVTEHNEHEEEKLDPTLIAGYLMYSWSSLAASITKLAGFLPFSLSSFSFNPNQVRNFVPRSDEVNEDVVVGGQYQCWASTRLGPGHIDWYWSQY